MMMMIGMMMINLDHAKVKAKTIGDHLQSIPTMEQNF